jgi:GTP-binding protein HflX
VSHPEAEEQIQAVNAVLKEIGADGKPTLMVFNKIDQLNGNRNMLVRFLERHPHGVAISASDGEGVPSLLAQLGSQLRPVRNFLELSVPHEQSGVIARLHEVGQIIERNYEGDTARFKVRIPPHLREEFAPFFVRELHQA